MPLREVDDGIKSSRPSGVAVSKGRCPTQGMHPAGVRWRTPRAGLERYSPHSVHLSFIAATMLRHSCGPELGSSIQACPMTEASENPRTLDFFSPWFGRNPRANWIFVSHTTSDEALIRPELEAIAKQRFLNLHILNGGRTFPMQDEYRRGILRSLSSSKWFVVVVSKKAERSSWVKFEVDWAVEHKSRAFIQAIRLDTTEPKSIHPDLAHVKTYNCQWLSVPGPMRWIARRRLAHALPRAPSFEECWKGW